MQMSSNGSADTDASSDIFGYNGQIRPTIVQILELKLIPD